MSDEPIDEVLAARLEQDDVIELHIALHFDGWPSLKAMSEEERRALCGRIDSALQSLACPVQAIKASTDMLIVIVDMSPDVSVDDIARTIVVAAGDDAPPDQRTAARSGADIDYSAEGIGPTDVVDAVVQLR